MSGNMSFANNNSVGAANHSLDSHRGNHGGGLERSVSSGGGYSRIFNRAARGSMSFSDANLSTSSIQDTSCSGLESEVYYDKDVWSTRVILSALEDVVFAETPYPKLPLPLIQAFQKFLLGMNAVISSCNGFVEFEKVMNTSEYGDDQDASWNKSRYEMEVGREVMDVLERATPESKVVLRSLVMAYVRNSASNIVEMWKPILKANEVEIPRLSGQSSSGLKRLEGGIPGGADYDLKVVLDLIVSQLKNFQKRSQELDGEIRDVLKLRDEEIIKFERDVKVFKEATLDILKEKSAQEDPDFVNQYLDYLELENQCLMEQMRLEELQKEAEENPEDIKKESEEAYKKLKDLYKTMLSEAGENEKRIEKYKSRGNEYLKVLEEYNTVMEEIKTKEWVREQLQNGPKDDSLLSDSFYE